MLDVLDVAVSLAEGICNVVRSVVGLRVRAERGVHSGDWQYLVDVRAERFITEFFKNLWNKGFEFGYLTEEQGLVFPCEDVDKVFIIDPVDGSRPAQRGLNSCNVVIGVVDYNGRVPRLCDIDIGVVKPLLGDLVFIGVVDRDRIYVVRDGDFEEACFEVSKIEDLNQCFVDIESYGLPSEVMGVVYSPIIESVNTYFVYHCLSYGLLSLIRGSVEAVVDVRPRIVEEFPEISARLSKKEIKFSSTMDIAGIYPLIRVSRIEFTDVFKKSLDYVPLWIEKEGRFCSTVRVSCLAASSQKLHDEFYKLLLEGIEYLKEFRNLLM